VIHIEDPIRGDASRGLDALDGGATNVGGVHISFETTNQNKKSMTLDLSKVKGRNIFYRLVKTSDIFVSNYSSSIISKLGIDYETLRQYNPRLIYAVTSGYGPKGPDAKKRAFDPIAQARSGIMFQFGDRDQQEPLQATGAIADQTGSFILGWGILAALVARERLGIGQKVETSLLASLISLQATNINLTLTRGYPTARHSRARAKNALSNMYQCGDDKWLILAEPQVDRFWHSFCQAVGIGELENDPKFSSTQSRRSNCKELISILSKLFLSRSRDEWLKILEPVGLACDVINTISDLRSDPQVIQNEYITNFSHPVLGPIEIVGFPISFSKTPAKISRAPAFGEHTEQILLEVLGYAWEEITQLKDEGVI
jgi:crotonobetainyl-CoA:carnitine CoA-transferase CaiB-like acyl-CoA transferase